MPDFFAWLLVPTDAILNRFLVVGNPQVYFASQSNYIYIYSVVSVCLFTFLK